MLNTVEMLGVPVLKDTDKPFVKFETQTIEDHAKTREDGVPRFKDQHYAICSHAGGKGNTIMKVDNFLKHMAQEAKQGRANPQWVQEWRADYELYKAGQEIPLHGTPIRGWKMISGARQEELIRLNILTVEALANLTDEGMQNLGMMALELKRRAQAWLAQDDKAGSAQKLKDAQRRCDELEKTVASMEAKLAELGKLVEVKGKLKAKAD